MQYTEAAISILFLWLFLRLGLIPTVVLVVAVAVPIPTEEPEELEEPQEPQFLQVPIPTEEAEEPQHPNEPPIAVLLHEGLDARHMLVVPRLVLLVVPRLVLLVVPRLAVVDTHTDKLHMHEEEDSMVDADYSHQLPPVVVEEGHRRLVHPNIEKAEEGEDMGSYRDREPMVVVADAQCQYRHQMFPLAGTSWQHRHRPILQSY